MPFDPLHSLISWESKKMVTHLSLPRKYTSTHDDAKGEIYLSVGKVYNEDLLSTKEVKDIQSEVLGVWKEMKHGTYQIHLRVRASTKENPNGRVRDAIFRRELPNVLHTIALAEAGLTAVHPELKRTRIYVTFESVDPVYYRKKEKWGRLGDY